MTTRKYKDDSGADAMAEEDQVRKKAEREAAAAINQTTLPRYAEGDKLMCRFRSGDVPIIILHCWNPDDPGLKYYAIEIDGDERVKQELAGGLGGQPETALFARPVEENGHTTTDELDPNKALDENFKPPKPATEDTEDTPPDGPVFESFSFDALLSMPPKSWLIDQVIGRGDIGMVYGPPGCGKTFVVIDLIMAACTGEQWAKRFDPVSKLNVAYCAGEGISGLPSRFKAAARHYGVTSLPTFTFFKTIPQLFIDGEEGYVGASIFRFVNEWKERQTEEQAKPLDLLVIDTLHTATTAADENSAKDMGKVLHFCRWAATELRCAVVLVHHTNKTGSAERGSSALRGAMDFMIEVRKVSETGTKAVMSCAKLKDGEQWREQTLDLTAMEDSVCVWWDEPGDGSQAAGQKATDKATLLAEMNRYRDTRFTAKSLAEAIAKQENYTRKLMSELESAGECKRTLSDPSRPQSNRNPWVYYVESAKAQTEAAEADMKEAGI
jgi:hypothetical protein